MCTHNEKCKKFGYLPGNSQAWTKDSSSGCSSCLMFVFLVVLDILLRMSLNSVNSSSKYTDHDCFWLWRYVYEHVIWNRYWIYLYMARRITSLTWKCMVKSMSLFFSMVNYSCYWNDRPIWCQIRFIRDTALIAIVYLLGVVSVEAIRWIVWWIGKSASSSWITYVITCEWSYIVFGIWEKNPLQLRWMR